MSERNSSAEASRSGLYLFGELVDVSATEYRESYKGTKEGRPFEIPAHYEQVLVVISLKMLYRAVIRYDDPIPGHESAHKVTMTKGGPVALQVKSVGKVSQGVATVYIEA